eukprot:CAMPEP_0202922110 /NCGR_PEP_ID=MMETSP1392-20130828/77753_1 /ASSEMBLY_ACC=CAM_ASM_000868 /TAXON_ID=225041 /ORGANISM="Chlamydomonas chlamydogama, Strain SAG 11-48b" /LENGTH=49 /DNA_ID=CAMNT_0049615721 /DNA_START=42 /DNA_END=192 /DNA_ORIENTATION=+
MAWHMGMPIKTTAVPDCRQPEKLLASSSLDLGWDSSGGGANLITRAPSW